MRADRVGAASRRRKGWYVASRYALFVLPGTLVYALFVLKPLLETGWLSLFEWDGAGSRTFIGLAHYAELVGDRVFRIALRNNLIWIVASIINPIFWGLILAVLLSACRRFTLFYRVSYFAPVVLNLVIVGIVWSLIYNPLFGALNAALQAVGLEHWTQGWLGDPFWVVPSIIIAGNWTFFGFCMMIFLAGLQTIDASLYEAAMIDGAGPIARFWHVTIPSLRHHINLIVVYAIIGSFKVFDIVYVMTQGGPNHASEVIATYLYWQVFSNGRVGYGTAMAVVLTFLVFAMSVTFLRAREAGDSA